MAKGSSGIGSTYVAKSVVTQSGDTVELSVPLVYGGYDSAVNAKARAVMEAQEDKRLGAKSEYGLLTDEDGNPIAPEKHGSRNGIKFSENEMTSAKILTHNHPRGKNEEGVLGGTFSTDDLNTFSKLDNMTTIRASAAEGTYSMTKGKNFNKSEFNSYVKSVEKKHYSTYHKEHQALKERARKEIAIGKMTSNQYISQAHGLFNNFLVNCHNDLIAGQKQYGYTYTLERRKKNG